MLLSLSINTDIHVRDKIPKYMANQKKKRTIIIGIGKQTIEDHLPALESSRNAQLIGIVDKEKSKLQHWSKKLNVPGYASISDAINATRPDFAIVVVPHDQYFDIIKKLVKSKIHILKEKPLALNYKEAVEIYKMTQRANVQLMVTLQRRFNPIFSTFQQLMHQIGKHFLVEAKYTIFVNDPSEGWRGHKSRAGGGCIIDMGYHLIDLLIWYFGLPNAIYAEFSSSARPKKRYDAEDTAVITFRYNKSGTYGSMILSRYIWPKTEYLKLIGSNGTVEVKRGSLTRTSKTGEVLEQLTREKSWTAAATQQIDYFCEMIDGKKKNIGSPKYHLQHMAFIEACYRSQKSKTLIDPYKILGKHA